MPPPNLAKAGPYDAEAAEKVKKLIERLEVRQTDVAREGGVKINALSSWLCGRNITTSAVIAAGEAAVAAEARQAEVEGFRDLSGDERALERARLRRPRLDRRVLRAREDLAPLRVVRHTQDRLVVRVGDGAADLERSAGAALNLQRAGPVSVAAAAVVNVLSSVGSIHRGLEASRPGKVAERRDPLC